MGIILAIVGIAGASYYVDQDFMVSSIDTVLSFTPDIQCNVAGDCIEFQIPIPPVNHDIIPVEYDIEIVTKAQYYENGTSKPPTESYITGIANDVSYSKSGAKISTYKSVGNVYMVQIGNVISIDGQIKIINPITKEIVEPRTALYTLIMSCSELSEFCNETGVTRRGVTSTAGTFNERITTNTSYVPALYNIEVFAISETKDTFGIPYDVTNVLYVEVYR